MSRNPHVFSRLSDKEESACKEVYDKYFLIIYAYVEWLIPDRQYAENITLHTLLQVCNHNNLHDNDTLLAFARRIATNKCLALFQKEPWRKKYYEEYLANNANSAELLEAAFNNALLMEKRLIEWKQLSPTEQEEFKSICDSLFTSINSFDMHYRWPDLLDKFMESNISETEKGELLRQADLSEIKKKQFNHFATPRGIVKQLIDLNKIDPAQTWESFKKQLNATRRPAVKPVRIMATAVLIFIFSTVVYHSFSPRPSSDTSCKPPYAMGNLTAEKGPELILSNRAIIKLDSVPDGVLIAPDIPFIKRNSTLEYVHIDPEDQVQAHCIDVLSVPPGRQYQITLADGTQIKVNASSQLYFPVSFSTNERWVAMKGEAYFEVNADPQRPFFVNVNNRLYTKVTGTAFNIEAYNESDCIKTTLVKGRLAITACNSRKSRSLQAGQQASFKNGSFIIHDTLNIPQVTAWKEGVFNFDKKSVNEIMQEIEHWYDVKIIYNGKMPVTTSTGIVSRSTPLWGIINGISMIYKIHIERTGDTLIVSPEY